MQWQMTFQASDLKGRKLLDNKSNPLEPSTIKGSLCHDMVKCRQTFRTEIRYSGSNY